MFLKRLTLVNWGNVPAGDFEFGPVSLFSGGNGSGKTTAADAIQTVMTAAHENLFQYNPGQEETTQRGRGGKRVRTLASYVLGCDDGSYARTEPTDGYVAAVFHPTAGESAEPFTALVGVRAWLDLSGKVPVAREDELMLMVLPAVELSLAALVQERGGVQHVVVLEELQRMLVSRHGKRSVELYDNKKRAYLRRLYGALRGLRDAVTEREAMAAARAFSRFMAYKPVSSISEFVADEVLERRDLGEAVRSVSSQLKTIHAMESEAQGYKDSAALLEQAGHHAQSYIEAWTERITQDYVSSRAGYLQCQSQYLQARQERDGLNRELEENAAELALTQQRREQAHHAVVMLEAQRQSIEPLRRKDELDSRCKRLEERLAETVRNLLRQDQQLQENLRCVHTLGELLASPSLATDLPQHTDMYARRLVEQARTSQKLVDIDLARLLQKDHTGDLAMLEQRLDEARAAQRVHAELHDYWKQAQGGASGRTLGAAAGASMAGGSDGRASGTGDGLRVGPAGSGGLAIGIGMGTGSGVGSGIGSGREWDIGVSRRDALAQTHQSRRQRYEQLSSQWQQKQQDIERLEAKQIVYPAYVERALTAIRAQLPKADPRVLCDYVEVADPAWQMAIEGYLGGARFQIIVEEDHEADAIRVVRGMPGRDNRARVMQGARALRDAARSKPHVDSIVHVLKFTHAVAQAFLTASYGNVVRVASAQELRQTSRGLTADGMGSGNYAMFRCDVPDADLVFGASARERALRARRSELEELIRQRQQANERLQESARLLEAVDRLQLLSYGDLMSAVLSTHREIRSVDLLLSQLDLGEHRSLDAQLAALRDAERKALDEYGELRKRSGKLDERRQGVAEKIERLSADKAQAQNAMVAAEEGLHVLHADWPEFDLEARLQYADQEAGAYDTARGASQRQDSDARLRNAERALDHAIQQHNQKCRAADAIVHTTFIGDYDVALFRGICALRREIDRIYNILKNNVLVEKHEQLKQLKTSFNDAFVSHLCQAIHQSIMDGRRQLDLLNKELVNHHFGSDRERFRFDADWVPEFREYWKFFEDVVRNPVIGEGETLFEARLSPKSQAVRDALMALLLGTDEQKSQRELERIADYRNYYRYEIYKEVEGKPPIALSEYGTGSGGQLETPAYIIRAASITSALRYGEGVNHLRMVLVDEAFSKMDEARSREVIGYLTRTLGLQLLFIMPTSKCGPFMDLISNEFVFAKVPSAPRGQLNTQVLVDRKECNQARIGELWAQHRRAVQQQAELDFMEDVIELKTASRDGR